MKAQLERSRSGARQALDVILDPHRHEPRWRRLPGSAGKPATKKPYQLNSCHVYKDDAPAVLERWPQFYTGRR